MVSHELKAPIAAVYGYLKIILGFINFIITGTKN
ncbi:MAG: hypothetical protein MZV64_20555 [Ignavibacteriales bacterium]|nr:hypothetical protein [Ignavibacteriales bacterium]